MNECIKNDVRCGNCEWIEIRSPICDDCFLKEPVSKEEEKLWQKISDGKVFDEMVANVKPATQPLELEVELVFRDITRTMKINHQELIAKSVYPRAKKFAAESGMLKEIYEKYSKDLE